MKVTDEVSCCRDEELDVTGKGNKQPQHYEVGVVLSRCGQVMGVVCAKIGFKKLTTILGLPSLLYHTYSCSRNSMRKSPDCRSCLNQCG